MTNPDGQELAIIVRRGPGGRLADDLTITLKWQSPHTKLTLPDPFAAESHRVRTQDADKPHAATVTLRGYQDALIILAQ